MVVDMNSKTKNITLKVNAELYTKNSENTVKREA